MVYHEHNVDYVAIQVVGQNWSSEVISLFLDDWEVWWVASSCNVRVELRVSGFSSFLAFGVPKKLFGRVVTAAKPFSHR